MTKGSKVRVVKIKTERGFEWSSLRDIMEKRMVGTVTGDATGGLSWPCCIVDFGSPETTLNVPTELLQRVR